MGKIAKKPKVFNGKKSRKVLRKEKRLEKKKRKFEYYVNRNKPTNEQENTKIDKKQGKVLQPSKKVPNVQSEKKKKGSDGSKGEKKFVDRHTKEMLDDKKRQQTLEREMRKQRKRQLEEANLEEDKVIKRLEKELKLHKRKTKAIPKSFASDGLDYLLEVCDPENMKNIASSENILDANDDFEEDFELITGKSKKSRMEQDDLSGGEESDENSMDEELGMDSDENDLNSDGNNSEDKKKLKKVKSRILQDGFFVDNIEESEDSQNYNSEEETIANKKKIEKSKKKTDKKTLKLELKTESIDDSNDEFEDIDNSNDEFDDNDASNNENEDSEEEFKSKANKKEELNKKKRKCRGDNFDSNDNSSKIKRKKITKSKNKKQNRDEDSNEDSGEIDSEEETMKRSLNENSADEEMSGSEQSEDFNDDKNSNVDSDEDDGMWEDIYGRKRNKDGTVISESLQKYIPPALRAQTDSKRSEKLNRLKRQIKGLINRLAENNMHSISTQIEELYMNNSRNDMNETLSQILFDSLISPVITPERLLLEHVMLITILHANVGTEVGAHFLLNIIRKFDSLIKVNDEVENKELDNTVHIIAQLYNFKIFHSQLLYQIIEQLSNRFEEKHVECILLVLKNVGFTLRKDDPVALKKIIIDLQKKATTVSSDDPRVKFLLDILLAIKNNNVTKIPNYDTTYSEHLKKLLKGFIRKGNYVTQLNITMDDLLKADERGKWWVVGSAWSGMDDKKTDNETKIKTTAYSQKLLQLAKKQRMNTDTRRNIFCIIMSAEDYLDAFEKLLHLGLKNQEEREIINVILHCCLQEKKFNPYYAILAKKFCEYDRKYQMMVRCLIWDKLKALDDCSASQLSSLAKLLAYLFIEQSLPISTLKVIEFADLDKITLRFMRQVLLQILLYENEETCIEVFSKVALSPKLKMFRDSLRLFIHHFLLKNLKEGMVGENQKELLKNRAQTVEKVLVAAEHKTQLF